MGWSHRGRAGMVTLSMIYLNGEVTTLSNISKGKASLLVDLSRSILSGWTIRPYVRSI